MTRKVEADEMVSVEQWRRDLLPEHFLARGISMDENDGEAFASRLHGDPTVRRLNVLVCRCLHIDSRWFSEFHDFCPLCNQFVLPAKDATIV